MKAKLAFLMLYAILLTTVDCIVVDSADEKNNSTTVIPSSDINENESVKNATAETENNDVKESRTIDDNDDKLPDFPMTTPTNIHKIPPTLQNVKKAEQPVNEKPEKSIKDFVNPTPAPIHNYNSLPEGKLKQAIIHSKQQTYKNLIDKSTGKLKDQIARPNEVQAVETPSRPTAKEFIPSPELSPIYTPENNVQNHFHPMSQYYRPPLKQDIHFPQENPFSTPQQVDTKWFGSGRTNDLNLNPNDINPHFMHQHGLLRNTHVEFPHHQVDREVHFHNPQDFHNHYNHFKHYHHNGGNSDAGERMIFPNDQNPFSEEIKTTVSIPTWPTKTPELNKNEMMKGSWKWVPEVETETPTFPSDTKFHTFHSFHSSPFHFDSHRPQTVRDRPYTFESTEIYSHHTTPPTGPSSAGTAEALISDEHTTTRDHEDEDKGKGEVKILRSPSPWKRFIHVMTAAIPIGIIISALTPRIVYIHPNATAPTLQPPYLQQPFSPPPPIPPSGPQNAPFQQAGPNSAFPLRQRAIDASHFNGHDVNESLSAFMKFMETKYREKHGVIEGACEDRFFCEIALMGANPNAELMHRTLYKVAIETPKAQAEKSGLKEIFTAIKRHNCGSFKCKRS